MAFMSKNFFLKWFHNQKIGKQMLYTFLAAVMIPILVALFLMLYVISNNLSEKVNAMMMNQLEQVAERTDLTLDIYTNLIYQIYIDSDMIGDIISYESAQEKDSAKIYRDVCDKLQQYGISAEGIECISIILPNGKDITYDFGMASAVDNIWNTYEDLREIEPYQEAQYIDTVSVSDTKMIKRGNEDVHVFHVSKKMYDLNNIQNGPIATIVMSVNENVLSKVCNTSKDVSEDEIFAVNFIIDDQGNVISFPNAFYTGIQLHKDRTVEQFVKNTGVLKGRNIAINQYENTASGWVFYNAYDQDSIFQEVHMINNITIILGAILICFSVLLIRYTVKMIEKSVHNIVDGIQEVQNGNLDTQVNVECGDEMRQIADNFNTMTDKIKGLIKEVTEVTEKQKEAEIKTLEAQIRALEAQINPHFLYNTLDSINWMAIEKEEYEISTMLRNLGIILRYGISKSNKKVTIDEMADWLERYLSLQKIRFENAFSWEISIDEEVRDAYIHKLLVQPFVENAILHGFKGIEVGGILRIDILLSEDRENVTIIIEDNGIGIPAEIIEKTKNVDKLLEEDKHIGLCNALFRMQMYYGDRAFWNVSSIQEIGTIVTLKVPVEKEE